jgi:threonine aldolase
LIARSLAGCPQLDPDVASVQTNIVIFNLRADDADSGRSSRRRDGAACWWSRPRTVRAVTHLDVSRDECERAGNLVEVAGGV